MHVISKKALQAFWAAHADAESPLRSWYRVASQAKWAKFADVRAVFPSADLVGDLVVFNIGGNKYRLIASIHFDKGRVYIQDVLTHKDYDKGQWKTPKRSTKGRTKKSENHHGEDPHSRH